ncbi:hypothetical protein BDN70DRAFT_936052 [Pholiota conissans]|uniref:Uncharacterized protein n=1 Tax=Pholiota conissans TaxID=109636 RepID=A0A9P5YTC2_9AGAR|nr:hypothetical protein BDN70DRAFT_936052 [Pholiota conissans]
MSSTTVSRRLSARRGSVTAPDPFGVHTTVNQDPNRSSSSTLTIVRVPAGSPAPVLPALNEPPASPVLSSRRLHRRIGQNPPPADPSTNRVSFAFSSFGPTGGPRASSPSGNPPSPSSSPRLRPSSPHLGATSFGGKPRLTPDQLVDLARQATIPRAHISSPSDVPTPATFTPLPDDIFLPFIDRPTEVAALISSPPDVKLFTLLAQTFAKPPPSAVDPTSTVAAADKQDGPVDLPRDPVQWTYPQLVYHLTKVDRDIAPDFIWSIAARKCILSHSELIWERIKGALGVPPELDVEYDFLDDDQESPDTSDISDDEGRAAKGHWSDWDEVMDSPMYTRNPKRLSAESPAASLYLAAKREEEAHFRTQVDDRLHGLQSSGYEQAPRADTGVLGLEASGDATIVPTPHLRSPPEQDQGGIVHGTFSPPLITHREPTSESNPEYISIEPLLAAAPSPSNFGTSGTTGDGLGDIAEGAEEEEEAAAESTNATDYLSANSNIPSPEDGMISPSQIQGLRICTSPLPPSTSPLPIAASTSFGTPPVLSPISPLPPYPSQPVQPSSSASSINNGSVGAGNQAQPIPSSGSHGPGSRTHSRASSFSSIGPFRRSESTGDLSASWLAMAAAAAGTSGSQYAGSVFGSDAGDSSGYLSDGDRGIGQPLFPSNFARLAGGPTMRANNPATRGSTTVPHTRYKSGGGTRSSGKTKARPAKTSSTTSGPSLGLSAAEKRLSWGAGSVSTAIASATPSRAA